MERLGVVKIWEGLDLVLDGNPKVSVLYHNIMAALSYSARRYDSAICCRKISRDTFLSEVLYEADSALECTIAHPRPRSRDVKGEAVGRAKM